MMKILQDDVIVSVKWVRCTKIVCNKCWDLLLQQIKD